MNLVLAVTKKRRNLIRIQRAYRTEHNRAVRARDQLLMEEVHQRKERLVKRVERTFRWDCGAS
jgi:hypothetical protein